VKTSDDERVARNAWELWKSITQLDTILWELFWDKFLDFDEEEEINKTENRSPDF
jgi:hypothetical protein